MLLDLAFCPLERAQSRPVELGLAAPSAQLHWSVVAPVKNEEDALPRLIRRLAEQRGLDGQALKAGSYEVILLLNNCEDRSAEVAARMRELFPDLRLHLAEITLPVEEAHVGRARQILFEVAASRFRELKRPGGIILTTDADTLPARDWIAQTAWEIARGVDGVGGRITLAAKERDNLPAGVRRFFLLDIGYRRALEEMRALYAPDEHDPFPRHHQHFGSSLAVTEAAFTAAGGMPLARSSEDVALYRAVLASGGKFRHSFRVQATTSARFAGRARGGLADALADWERQYQTGEAGLVESAAAAEDRLASWGLRRRRLPTAAVPPETPNQPSPAEAEPIADTLRQLRARNAALRVMTLEERLLDAGQRLEIALAA